MMRYFLALLSLFLSLPVLAADTNSYPSTLVDSTCTDDYDAPAAYSTAQPHSLIVRDPVIVDTALVQTSGDPDGYCDNDSRILASSTALVADTTFGPFRGIGVKGVILLIDGDAVTGGDTKYHLSLATKKPHDAAVVELDDSADVTGNGSVIIDFGTDVGTPSSATQSLAAPIPSIFYIKLDLNTATSWAGDISMRLWR